MKDLKKVMLKGTTLPPQDIVKFMDLVTILILELKAHANLHFS